MDDPIAISSGSLGSCQSRARETRVPVRERRDNADQVLPGTYYVPCTVDGESSFERGGQARLETARLWRPGRRWLHEYVV